MLVEDLPPALQKRFQEGIQLFNQRQFWEAHEAWEDVWREVDGDPRRVIQGFIQAAAAYHLILTRPRMNGALRNIEKALGKFEGMPSVCFGISVDRLRRTLERAHQEAQRRGQDDLAELGEDFVAML